MLKMKNLIKIVLFLWVCSCNSANATVSYDDRAILINGQRKILIAGSIHYPRSTPEVIMHTQRSIN